MEVNVKQDWSAYKPESFPFRGNWVRNWFSNMEESEIVLNNIRFRSVENFYQAMKSTSALETIIIGQVSPFDAKKMGRKVLAKREDWEESKFKFMEIGLTQKFKIPKWKEKLLATEDDMIIEWNNWGDKIWGVSIHDCKGSNELGKILMKIRDNIRNNS